MSDQPLLFSCESMLDIHPLHNFKRLFRNLNASHLDHNYTTGRKPFSAESMLRAIIRSRSTPFDQRNVQTASSR